MQPEQTTAQTTRQPSAARRWLGRLGRFVFVLLVMGLLVGAGLAAWLHVTIVARLPDLESLDDFRPSSAVEVFDAAGEQIDQFYVERRFWVALDELPDRVWQAFVSAEDRRYFEHGGADAMGILRALAANARAGRTVQGGSTITQQVVKNVLVGGERSYRRKLREAVLARRLERRLGKRKVLELYLNLVALGSGNYGVEAASRDYFGVSARDLDLGQAALLAGLVPAPSRYSPWVSPDIARRRRELVLRGMVRDGYAEADSAAFFLDEPVVVPREGSRPRPAVAYITEVRREIRRLLGTEAPHRTGLRVHTPLDSRLQATAQAAAVATLEAHAKRQGPRGIHRILAPRGIPGFLARGAGLPRDEQGRLLPPEAGACFDAVVRGDGALAAGPYELDLTPAALKVMVELPGEDKRRTLRATLAPGHVLAVCSDGTTVELDPAPWAEAAAVVIENATGSVLAVVGGRETSVEGFVRATQARRQPGSSFKPYVYGAALAAGRTQLDTVLDAPLTLGAGAGAWSPRNYGGGYAGRLPMRTALARSLNTVAVRLLLEVGTGEVARLARALGVRSPLRRDATLALGSSEVTPLDQALGYTAIARLGRPIEPVWVSRVEDATGTPLASVGQTMTLAGEASVVLPGAPMAPVLDPGVAYELADMMSEVVRAGTARRAYKPGVFRAGKTGTTNGFQDAWFVGFTASHSRP